VFSDPSPPADREEQTTAHAIGWVPARTLTESCGVLDSADLKAKAEHRQNARTMTLEGRPEMLSQSSYAYAVPIISKMDARGSISTPITAGLWI
jgi:hypothetical protein